MTERTYEFPVWGTQGGGLVREVNGTYIFVEKPDCPGLDVGNEMPKEWDVIPANKFARSQDEVETYGYDHSIPWDQQPDGVSSFLAMPDRVMHDMFKK